ncbi:hypothetical protein F442_08923 [Phytophthora nicotianae P10297]|uniref:Uncharacterized protein n=1 Tax=Phytophthora nicotianae P10297 TaxID=1317064 RepID=W2ZBV3_PHYNI|nr:hypothetical protein F442_08923 [Phytophthora nicotianae P10297]
MPSISKRQHGGDDQDPDAAKRSRTESTVEEAAQQREGNQIQAVVIKQTESASSHQFDRLKDVSFPCAILALRHVLSHIDTLLMSPDEAAIEAARTGQLKWLNEIIHRFDECDLRDAFVEAAGSGHADIVARLYVYIEPTLEDEVQEAVARVCKAITRAATSGHLNVMQFLLSEKVDLFETTGVTTYKGIIPAFDSAAENGHLDIVKFMVNHAKLKKYKWILAEWRLVDALSCAIFLKHTEIVEFLFSVFEGFHWNLKSALIAAVHAEGKDIIKRIYELYPTTSYRESNLFVGLARDDLYIRGVKYLYEHGWDDITLLSDAFVAAASRGSVETLAFFLDTGRISQQLFDKAFEKAVESEGAVEFLYEKKRASSLAINQAFVSTNSPTLIKLLYENEQIPNDSISTAFTKACKAKRTYINQSSKDNNRMDIVKYLMKLDCIPAEVIGEAFAYAAKHFDSEIMKFLAEDKRLSPDDAFLGAVVYGDRKLMESTYDVERISPETILTAFTKVSVSDSPDILQRLVQYLCIKPHVPQAMRHTAFVYAAKRRLVWALKVLNESEDGKLPLALLKEALASATDDEAGHYIRKIICEQLFDGKVECGCGCDALVAAVKVLPYEAPYFETRGQDEDNWDLATDLVCSAAENGHLDVLPDAAYYDPDIISYAPVDDEYVSDLYNLVQEALRKAAVKGNLSVVKFLAGQAFIVGFLHGLNKACGLNDAFSYAIREGHGDVIDYLLRLHPHCLIWNMKEACEAAVEQDKQELVEKIYELYSLDNSGCS